MEDGAPTLEVGFEIDTGGSFASLTQLDGLIDRATANAVAEFAKVEKASAGMLNLGSATASVTAFGNAYTREGANIARAKGQIEKQGEALIRQLDREAASIGQTRAQMRDAKIEATALAAAEAGLADVADRLLASARKRQSAAEAVAQAETEAAQRAVAAVDQEEQAIRSAARAYEMFNAVAKQQMAIYREQQAVEAAAAKEVEAARARADAEAAVNAQLLERSRIEAALERNTGVGRTSAVDNGATFSALAAKAAEDEARADLVAASAAKQLADEHARLAAMVQGSHAAQEADAAAAERLRETTDPLYAATKRLNAEIAESTRLYHAGATAPEEYARQQQVLTGRLAEASQQHTALAGAAGKSSFALRQTALQIPDIVQGLLTGQHPMTVFIQQGGQIAQVGMMAEGGLKGFARELGGVALRFAPFAAAAAIGVAGFELFDRSVAKGIDTKAMVDGLGLTRAEIKRLKDTSVDTGDVVKATFQVMAERVGLHLNSITGWFGKAMDYLTKVGADTMAGLYAGFTGTFDAIGIIVRNIKDGKFGNILGDIDKDMTTRFNQARGALNRFGADVTKQIGSNKLADLQKQANELKLDRTPKKPKVDHHAEQLGRENAAIEAQINNLYALAAAYKVSDAAALIAEARVKAESDAIKKRGDIEVFVDRQIRLAIAQRVSDAEKGAAAVRDQARIQTEVNGMVAAGNVPAERANELLQERVAELPLLAAIEAAQQRGLTAEADRATKALRDQRDAQEDAKAAARGAQFVADDAAADKRLAQLREEARLVGATDAARVHALATLQATQEAEAKFGTGTQFAADYIAKQVAIADGQQALTQAQDAYNDSLSFTADLFDAIDQSAQTAAQGISEAFGNAGAAIGDALTSVTGYYARQASLQQAHDAAIKRAGKNQDQIAHENALYATRSAGAQVAAYGDIASAAKGLFKTHSAGYKAMEAAEKAFRAIELALAVKNALEQVGLIGTHVAAKVVGDTTMAVSDTARAGVEQSNSLATTAVKAVEAVVNAIKSLPFPANIAAGVATAAAIAALGVSVVGGFGGSSHKVDPGNTGTGTVLGDSTAKSDSIKNAIDALKEVDLLTNTYSRQMAASLKSIDGQIGGVAAQIVKGGDAATGASVTEGFKTNAIGSVLSKIPLIGSFLGSLFGSKTTVEASGLYGKAQSVGSILSGGYNASTYSDVEKTSKFLGITTGHSYSTQYGNLDPDLQNQFTLILKSFDDAIAAAAGPLGQSTDAIQQKLNGFVVDIGKIDLKGLTGEEIQDKLTAVFGAAADDMANAAFPGIEQFQKVGEGAFETLVRVSSTAEAVTTALDELGASTASLGVSAKLGLADQFDSISDLTSAADAYFQSFYTQAEQATAKTAQLGKVFDSLGLSMPDTLAGFRQLVEAQDLTTAAGQATYATLLQLAPAFADLKTSMDGAKSAADITSERQDLQRQLLELQGNTAAIRALDLAKLDASNRSLQEQVWAVQDAQDAAKTAQDLADAWKTVGDSIMDEVNRIRGLTDPTGDGSFATLMGQFNAATSAARGGDQDAAKSLPGLSQALLKVAADTATSRQELDRIQAATAASLEATYGVVGALAQTSTATSADGSAAVAAATQANATTPAAANDDLVSAIEAMHDEIADLRSDLNAANATIASNTGRTARMLEDVTTASGGEAITVTSVAA